ncbi:MAG: HAD family hydrolase [Actinomyces sp.]|nr:MAG: HAD family hydrolase [Actinomyces sp.]
MILAFDADDTLWHNETRFQAVHRAFEELLAEWADATTVDDTLFATETRNLPLFGYGVKSFTLSMIETAVELSDGAVDAARIARIIELGRHLLDAPVELLPDVPEVLDTLAGRHRLALVTKGDLYDQLSKIERSGLADRFWRTEVVAHKDTATYAGVFARWGVPAAEVVMIGNSLRSDVLPVLELGGRGVHVPYEVTWRHEHVDPVPGVPVLERLADLPALVEAWTADPRAADTQTSDTGPADTRAADTAGGAA